MVFRAREGSEIPEAAKALARQVERLAEYVGVDFLVPFLLLEVGAKSMGCRVFHPMEVNHNSAFHCVLSFVFVPPLVDTPVLEEVSRVLEYVTQKVHMPNI